MTQYQQVVVGSKWTTAAAADGDDDDDSAVENGEETCAGDRLVTLDDGSCYDLDRLHQDALLNHLKEWDYPIFDLLDQYGEHILSAVSCLLLLRSPLVR